MPSSPSTEPAVLTVDRLRLETAERVLIEEATFSLSPGQHVAVVGRNGSGKTTLFDVIAAAFTDTPRPTYATVGGRVSGARNLRFGYSPQHPGPGEDGGTVGDYLERRSGEPARVHARYAQLTDDPGAVSRHLDEYGRLVERLDALEAWDYPDRQERVLAGMGIGRDALPRTLAALSGGQTTKLALAGLLLADPDLLLLDEPTNNLDDASRGFLRDWIRASRAAVLVVSHDRDLLDAVTDTVIEIDEETRRVELHGGNYSFYTQVKREQFAARVRAFEEQEARRRALLASAGLLSANAQRFQARSNNDFHRARGKKVARRASAQRTRVERELSALDEPQPPRRPRIEVSQGRARTGLVLAAHDISFGYPGAGPLLERLGLRLRHGERLALSGPNGAGKTTLLKLLIGQLSPASGHVERDPTASMCYLPQSVADPSQTISAVEHARRLATVSEDRARELIGKVIFADVGDLPLASFSAGERRRIELAVLFAAAPDVVVLDEPTNHLDLHTIEMLEEALDAYTGAVLAVSHDARFLRRARLGRDVALGAG